MEEIIKVSCDDEEFNIKINGSNIDILDCIVEIIKAMERDSGLEIETSLRYINKMFEEISK